MIRRFAEKHPQIARDQVVGMGEADDERPGSFAASRADLDGQRADVPADHAAFDAAHEAGLDFRVSAARSSFTFCRDLRVIFSVPSRMASRAAPRMRWDSEPIMPPVRSWR